MIKIAFCLLLITKAYLDSLHIYTRIGNSTELSTFHRKKCILFPFFSLCLIFLRAKSMHLCTNTQMRYCILYTYLYKHINSNLHWCFQCFPYHFLHFISPKDIHLFHTNANKVTTSTFCWIIDWYQLYRSAPIL